MKIMIFTEGTIIMHQNAVGHTREQIMRQVRDDEPSIHSYFSYVPIGGAVRKLTHWKDQGAQIFYLTSRTKEEEISGIKNVLRKFCFPEGQLVFRRDGEEYKDVAERIAPDVLVEDDCESIGGTNKMTITFIDPSIKKKIVSVQIREFGGIDHLEDDIHTYAKSV